MEQGMNFRVGQGFDVHAFADGDHVIICGVRIPHHRGLSAHSDGDVALHALCDAMLGAAALGDIGKHFPPDDPRFKDADSRSLTRSVMELLNNQGWAVKNRTSYRCDGGKPFLRFGGR
jgi:2-C-methyl-D-erythritol 2,4-cyclodiphosphate synthase